jgi:hypothetical protein
MAILDAKLKMLTFGASFVFEAVPPRSRELRLVKLIGAGCSLAALLRAAVDLEDVAAC